MKLWLLILLTLLIPVSVSAQIVSPGGGQILSSATVVGGSCTNPQFVQAIGTNGAPTCATPSPQALPNGAPPQFVGYSGTNVGEAETLGGDATVTRTGANAYSLVVTKTNGTAFGTLATAAVPLSIANGGRGSATAPTAGMIDIAQSATTFGAVAMSGDATITSAGAITVTKSGGTLLTSLFLPINNPTATGTLTLSGAGPGSLVINDVTNSSILFGTAAPWVGSVFGYGTSGALYFSGSSHFAGGSWVADYTSASILGMGTSGSLFYYNTGLTSGTTYTATQVAAIDNTGINLAAGETFKVNGVSIGGTCGAGSYVSALSGAGVTTCGPNLGTIYAPLASPTFTGTVTAPTLNVTGTLSFPDGSTYTTAGHNTMKALGIGVVAPTTAGGLVQGTYTGNGNAYMQITNADTTDTQAYSTYYLSNGTHYGSMQLAGIGATFNGPSADNLSIATSAANGINFVTNNAGANINFWVNTLANGVLSVQQTGIVLGGPADIRYYSGTQPSAYIGSNAAANLNIAAGGHFNGSSWIADSSSFHDLSFQVVGGSMGFNFYENTGLTVGSAFTPAQIGYMTANNPGGGYVSGLRVSPGQFYTCENGFTNVANSAQVYVLGTGVWGAAYTGFLTVYSTFSGAVREDLYNISSFGSPASTTFSTAQSTCYGGGCSPFTLTQVGATDGGGNPYTKYMVTNTSGQTVTIYYWFTQVGGGSYAYCQ